jgi:uncharacterized protein YkuJ
MPKPSDMKMYDNFQKNGKTIVEVARENEAHSKEPEEIFLQRELSPNDGYRRTV